MPSPTILITGGAGFIGSHVNQLLHRHGYQTVVFDNLSSGAAEAVTHGTFIKGDLHNLGDVRRAFDHSPIAAVMHFAAFTDVGESVTSPADYYQNNVINTLHLLDTMRQYAVKTFVFSSSAAIFGLPQHIPIVEDQPCCPINPYGRTKLMVEDILGDYERPYGIRFSCLRYFNAAGGDPTGAIKNYKKKECNLIPLVLRSLLGAGKALTIYGTDYPTPDGTCIRDYVHVEDLATAHLLAMQRLERTDTSSNYNLGNGRGFSVREVIAAVEAVTGRRVNVVEGPRRPGDPPVLVADAQKAHRELGWRPAFPDLDSMVSHAWQALPQ